MPINIDMLRNNPLFERLDNDELAELAAHIDETIYKPNQLIWKLGDAGANLQIVLEGKVEISVTDDDQNKVILDEIEPGEMFGELSLLDSEPRSATALALAQTTTFIIDRDDLLRLFTKKPAAALDILEILGKRIRHTDALVRTRITRNVNEMVNEKMTFGQRLADRVASFGGSWNFISIFGTLLVLWIIFNAISNKPPDPYPFILLNLILSMLAAMQAPIIMMSQNRQAAKDRIEADLDYRTNLKAEIEIMQLHQKMDQLREKEILQLRQLMDELRVEMRAHSAEKPVS